RTGGAQSGIELLKVGAERKQSNGQRDWNRPVKAIEKHQFRILCPVCDASVIGGDVRARSYPTYVGPPEAALPGRMDVAGLVRLRVVLTMMSGPPQRTPLNGCGADDREEKLYRSRRAK